MDITPAIPEGRQVIQSYGDNLFRISGTVWRQPVLVMPLRTVPWLATDVASMTFETFEPILSASPAVEVLLIGCGPRMALVSPSVRAALKERGVVTDLMDTGAACRTYNVLMAEDRRVAVALIPVP